MSKFVLNNRVIYRGRNGGEHTGVVQGFAGPESAKMVDLKLDGSKREHFFVPEDACTLIPDELGDIIISS